MYARLIWILPTAWGLYYSCLDREHSLKALEQRQVLARDSGALQRATGKSVYNPKKRKKKKKQGGRQREKQGPLHLPFTGFTLIEISFALK